MAVDTRDKRFSCLSVARTFTVSAPNPDASISSTADRQQIAFTYRGILPTEQVYWVITFATSTQKTTGGLTVTSTTGGLAINDAVGGLTFRPTANLPTLPFGTGFLITSAGEYLTNSNDDYLIVNL